MWLLVIEPGTSGRAANDLNFWAMSPCPHYGFLRHPASVFTSGISAHSWLAWEGRCYLLVIKNFHHFKGVPARATVYGTRPLWQRLADIACKAATPLPGTSGSQKFLGISAVEQSRGGQIKLQAQTMSAGSCCSHYTVCVFFFCLFCFMYMNISLICMYIYMGRPKIGRFP